MDKMGMIKNGIRFAVTGLVELFLGAATNCVLGEVKGGKAAKLGAKVGGVLIGMYVGDKVTDYICEGVDEVIDGLNNIETDVEETDGRE